MTLQPGISFAIRLLFFSATVLSGHYLVTKFTPVIPAWSLFSMFYLFLFLITLGSYLVLLKIAQRNKDRIGFGFLGLSFVKMIIAVAFLFPFIRSEEPGRINIIVQFMALYLLFLFFEVIAVYKLLKKTVDQGD